MEMKAGQQQQQQ